MSHSIPQLLNFERGFSDEDRLVQKSARTFVDQEVRPLIAEAFEAQRFPAQLVPRMGALGLLAPMLPEEYGGSGASALQYGLICRELERADSAIRSFCSVQSSLVALPIFRFGSDEQRAQWLRKLVAGEVIGCFALTEPDFGSNPAGMRTRAVKKGNEIVLNGSKRWITNADIADVSIVWAKDEEGVVGGYLVEKGRPGLSQQPIHHKLSLCASHTGELILEDCRIPLENQLPAALGLRAAFTALDSARFGIIWGALGVAEECYSVALSYAQSRVQFTRPIAAYQLVQAKLVDMLIEISKAQLLAREIATVRDAGQGSFEHISLGKLNNVRIALDIARSAREILGANGISNEYSVMRHMLNLESVLTYEGTEDIHRLILGKSITGYEAFT